MEIVGFNLTKLYIEKKENITGKWSVNTKIDIKEVKEEKVKLVEDKQVVRLEFEYSINYDPKIAEISFKGIILLMDDPKKTKEMINEWSKKREVLSDIKLQIFNSIFYKCNIKALQLEEDINLPPHLQLPTIKAQEPGEKTKASYMG